MKAKMLVFYAAVMIGALLMTGCSSKMIEASDNAMSATSMNTDYNGSYQSDGFEYYAKDDMAYEESKVSGTAPQAPESQTDTTQSLPENTNRKLIRRVALSTESKDFEGLIEFVGTQTNLYGGYIENSEISGSSYRYNGTNRWANIIIRIPSSHLDDFITQIGNKANITSKSESSEDVTLSYIETESRIASLEIQRDKLLAWMEDAETVEDLIQLEARLSEVRTELEYHGALLRNYDNLVAFSTITLNISEVERITIVEPETVGDRIVKGLTDNFYDIGEGMKNFLVWFVTSLPYLLIWAVLIVIILVVLRVIYKRSKKKREAKRLQYQNQYYAAQMACTQQNVTTVEENKESPNNEGRINA